MKWVLLLNNFLSPLHLLVLNSDILKINSLDNYLVFLSIDFDDLSLCVLVSSSYDFDDIIFDDVPFG